MPPSAVGNLRDPGLITTIVMETLLEARVLDEQPPKIFLSFIAYYKGEFFDELGAGSSSALDVFEEGKHIQLVGFNEVEVNDAVHALQLIK